MDLLDENINWLMESAAIVENAVEDNAAIEIRAEEDRQLELFFKLLKGAFRTEPLISNAKAFGVVNTLEDFFALQRNLKALGYFFSIRSSRTKKPSDNKKIIFNDPFKLSKGHPFSVEKSVNLYCSAGRNHNREARKRCEGSSASNKLTDCKAKMAMKEVHVFCKYKVPSQKQQHSKVLQSLKPEIEKGTAVIDHQFWIWVSLPRMHHHPLQLPSRVIDSEVKAGMYALVGQQSMTIKEVKKKLFKIVGQDFADKPIKPKYENSAFYPSEKVIYNHLKREGIIVKKRRKKDNINLVRTQALSSLEKLKDSITKSNDASAIKLVVTQLAKALEVLPCGKAEAVAIAS